jgi:hypothetical protein
MVVVAVVVAALGHRPAEFSVIKNVVTEANLHECSAPSPKWPIVFQIRN